MHEPRSLKGVVPDVPLPTPSPSDDDLAEINNMLDWHAGTLLPDGRLLGRLGRNPGKRTEPGIIPDRRLALLNQVIPLKEKRVLEVGCFEGIHTIGLRHYSSDVTAIDVRPQNVIKTLARLSWHGLSANVQQFDAERITPAFPAFDIVVHIGVLYHMMRPVEHLANLAPICDHLLLDTHVADADNATPFMVAGQAYAGAARAEGGWRDPFSGKEASAVWLTRDSLLTALFAAGFSDVLVLQERQERHGPRLLVLAGRAQLPSTRSGSRVTDPRSPRGA